MYTPVAYTGIAISCKRKFSHLEKFIAHSMMKSPNSMLPTSCRIVATKIMKKENSWWWQENNMSILFLIKSSSCPFELLFWSLSNLTLRMNSCVDISCCCCIFSVQPITSLVCFFVVIALTHGSIRTFRVQHELPRVVVSASFPTFRSVRIVL